jgi:hypothetical protein
LRTIGMRNMGMLIAIAFIVIPMAVRAETWTAHTTLEKEKSAGRCAEQAVAYTLDLTDNTFIATSQYGKMFSITVPADGAIKQAYKRVGPMGFWKLEMTGNVKSRELAVVVVNWHCYYRLIQDS